MTPPSLREILEFQERMARLDALIDAARPDLMERFPEIIGIMATQSYKILIDTTTDETAPLRGALQEAFGGQEIIVRKTDAPAAEWPLMKMLANDRGGLDPLMCGYHLSVESDEAGGYFDMRLGEDTPENRAVVQNAFPGARIKFAKDENPLTISLVPG